VNTRFQCSVDGLDTVASTTRNDRASAILNPPNSSGSSCSVSSANVTSPGWSQVVADVFIAETGADMTVFPTAADSASWAGVVPGCNESAGRIKSGATGPGNRHLKAALGVAALSAARTKDT
jgi:transposase